LLGLSPQGRTLWEQDAVGRPFDSVVVGERLIFTVERRDGPVWSIDPSGPVAWNAPISGRLVVANGRVFLYAADGIYALDAGTLSAQRPYPLPRGFRNSGDIVALPDGGLLVAHQDLYDGRLIALNADGTVRWERSYAHAVQGDPQLLMLDGGPFLVVNSGATSARGKLTILAVDLDSAELTRIFTAGSLDSRTETGVASAVGDHHILLNLGAGHLVLLDTQLALEAASQVTNSQ
jgi:outer membrane protein assembly factor BamB